MELGARVTALGKNQVNLRLLTLLLSRSLSQRSINTHTWRKLLHSWMLWNQVEWGCGRSGKTESWWTGKGGRTKNSKFSSALRKNSIAGVRNLPLLAIFLASCMRGKLGVDTTSVTWLNHVSPACFPQPNQSGMGAWLNTANYTWRGDLVRLSSSRDKLQERDRLVNHIFSPGEYIFMIEPLGL